MHISHHAAQRMSQRGISRRLVDFALRYGRIDGNKHILDRNESRRLIEALTEELRLAKRVRRAALRQGGEDLVVAEARRHFGMPESPLRFAADLASPLYLPARAASN